MITIDFDNHIKEASQKYLKDGTSLNETITKLANEQGLNRHQVERVVEGVNTEVYMQLFNKTDDKYIQFENADINKIADQVFHEEKIADVSISDYDEPPEQERLSGSLDLLKTAEAKEELENEDALLREFYKFSALETRFENSLQEINVDFQQSVDQLHYMVKQAVLAGTSFGDIESAIKSIHEDPITEEAIEEIHEKLAAELYPRQFEEEATQFGTINMEHPLIKQSMKIVKCAQEYANLREKRFENLEALYDLEKEAGKTKQTLGLFQKVRRYLFGKPKPKAKVKPKGKATAKAPVQQQQVAKPLTTRQKQFRAFVGGGAAGGIGGAALMNHKRNFENRRLSYGSIPAGYGR